MEKNSTIKNRVAGVLVFVCVVGFVYSCVLSETSVDLLTGKTRMRTRCLGVTAHMNIRDNALSHAVQDSVEYQPQSAEWVIVSEVYSFKSFSPHFRHHEVAALIKSLCLASEISGCSKSELGRIGTSVLNRIRQGDLAGAEEIAQLWITKQLVKSKGSGVNGTVIRVERGR